MQTDAQIQTNVMQELKWDPSVTHEHIGVAVTGGIVTLSGIVPTFAERSSAETAAQRVSGVKAVVEKIEVKIAGTHRRDDQDIADAIVNQFSWHTQIPDDRIQARVENGWVELTGDVDWYFQKGAAEDAVRGLSGVKGIANRIVIKAKSVQPAIIKDHIEQALTRTAEREASRIDVLVEGGRAILSGEVRSFAELRAVKGAALGSPGVISVDDARLTISAA